MPSRVGAPDIWGPVYDGMYQETNADIGPVAVSSTPWMGRVTSTLVLM